MAHPPRPLSPHLTIYRWQLTSMVMSITHRATGVALSFGLIFFALWLWAAAYDAETFATWQEFYASSLGIIMLAGWLFSLYFHSFNGIRHLFWDAVLGFALKNSDRSGIAVLLLTVVATALTLAYAFTDGGVHV